MSEKYLQFTVVGFDVCFYFKLRLLLLLLSTLQKSDLLSHKRKLLYEGRIKWMSAHGKAFGL